MKFELLFDGDLVSSGNKHKHVDEKWDIRRAIEPQLKELWESHPALSGIGLSSSPRESRLGSLTTILNRQSVKRLVL